MSSGRSTYQRIRRRETRSPRSVAAITLAVVVMATLAWLAVEIVLAMLDLPPLLVAPAEMAAALVAVTSVPGAMLMGAGLLIALIGAVLIALAVAPGRRGRHLMESPRRVVVDDDVVASAIARHAASVAGVGPDQARVTVSRRRVDVHLTPTSGFPIDRAAVLNVVGDALDSYRLEPALEPPRLSVAEQGRVGA
ncbi:DUF6286 domain-containing protein [Microbacterium sp. NPDC055455]